MTRAEAILYTLVAYKLVLVAIGLWAARRNLDTADFFLGGRRLGGWVAAISASRVLPARWNSPSRVQTLAWLSRARSGSSASNSAS